MRMRSFGLGLIAMLGIVLTGCERSAESQNARKVAAPDSLSDAGNVLLRIHWLGKKRLAADSSASRLMSIWGLPESARLETQTLDKLAVAPWLHSLTNHQFPIANYQAALRSSPARYLRPLLDDLLQQESFVEMRQTTNWVVELALAIRLDPQRAALWQTNLAAVLQSVPGAHPVSAQSTAFAWTVPMTRHGSAATNPIELSRAGDWTLLGFGHASNDLVADMAARIHARPGGAPFIAGKTNYWLEADLNLAGVRNAFPTASNIPPRWPKISLTVTGDGTNVLTTARLSFSSPLNLEMKPWNIPTDLIHDPLASFTAVRGCKPWFSSWKGWTDLQLGEPPGQLYSWSQQPLPPLLFAAAPVSDPAGFIQRLLRSCSQSLNPDLEQHRFGKIEQSTNANELIWAGAPLMAPFVRLARQPNGFILGGLASSALTNFPAPAGMFRDVLSRNNLVYYDWELTGERLEAWWNLGQLFRVIFSKAQLPDNCASIAWFKAAHSKLGPSGTIVVQNGPDELLLRRSSGIGFTGIELQLIADWLESPEFPKGLHTLLTPVKNRPTGHARRSLQGR